jgi:hypothetical protein
VPRAVRRPHRAVGRRGITDRRESDGSRGAGVTDVTARSPELGQFDGTKRARLPARLGPQLPEHRLPRPSAPDSDAAPDRAPDAARETPARTASKPSAGASAARASQRASARQDAAGVADAVPLDEYVRIMRSQALRRPEVRPADMERAFEGVVLDAQVIDRLGIALNAARPILVHGPDGAGKTFVAERLARALRDDVLVPRAVAIHGEVVRIFDPLVHVALGEGPRGWMRVRRPIVRVGAELTPAALDLHPSRVPLQLAAAGGVLFVDELGRQRAPVAAIAAPLLAAAERGGIAITLKSGRREILPFTARVVFASALPLAMIEQSGIRSALGAVIPVGAMPEPQYVELIESIAAARGVESEPAGVYRLLTLHRETGRGLLAGTAAALVGAIADRARYVGEPAVLSTACIDWAWCERFGATPAIASPTMPPPRTAGARRRDMRLVVSRKSTEPTEG